jgi:replication factor C subunit 2/4
MENILQDKLTSTFALPWIEKYRPSNLDDIILPKFIKDIIVNTINSSNIKNMIITGDPSTGKTSTALIIAKEIFGEYFDDFVLELNASDDRGLTVINNIIIPFCKKSFIDSNGEKRKRLIILDESDFITIKAQQLLINIISDYINSISFIFICNTYNCIISGIQSQCLIINFSEINSKDILCKIKEICNLENVIYDNDDSLLYLIKLLNNDIRKIISNIECIHYSSNQVNIENINKIVKTPKKDIIIQLIYCIENKDYGKTFDLINYFIDSKDRLSPDYLTSYIMKILFSNQVNIKLENKINMYKILSEYLLLFEKKYNTRIQLYDCINKIIENMKI